MSTQGATEARAVDWSFPMNPSHLPPKSPGSFSSFGAGIVDSSAAGRTTLPSRAGNHKRTPSAGFLAQTQPTWMDGVVDVPELGPFKRGAHRRSASESMAFLDGTNFSKMVDDNNMHEDDDYESRSVASMHSGGGSVDFDRLDEDPFLSMFGNEGELTPKRQQCNGRSNDDPASPSDSNSLSEVSNDDPKAGLGKDKSEPDVQSSEGGTQLLSKGELQQALAGLDFSLDHKRAKRILANRQSAQRSRVRKLQYISELERNVTALQSKISSMAPQVAFFEHRRAVLNVDNNSIKQKMGTLLQGQLFKDAHNEALQKEVQRLRQLYQQQQHQNMQQEQDSQLGVSLSAYNLQYQQFNKQELGATLQAEATFAANLSPMRFGTWPLPHSLNAIEASTW